MSTFDKLSADLDAAIKELRVLVSSELRSRHDRPGPISRDVMTARVLMQHPDLHERIESLTSADELHKARAIAPGGPQPIRKFWDDEVEREAHQLVASGAVETIEKARVRAWQSDRERLDAYHFPGAATHGAEAVDAAQAKRAADKAIDEIAKVLGAGDYVLGHRLACANFPQLAAAARGTPQLVR